ncbi:cytochrome P450 [Cytidiella melzeri]|nr:cytochrome P450 [Cytidiella melzeri]
MALRDLAPSLALRDVLAVHAGTSLITHYIFKRWEPTNLKLIASLLLIPPVPLAFLLLPHATSLALALVASNCLFLGTLVASILAYRLSPFHPLASYPGPVMCRVSKLWMVWVTRGGSQHLWYQRLHQTYGDAIRVGPNELSFRDPSILTAFMGTTGLPKGPGRSAQGMYPPVRSLIMQRDPVEHLRRRKPWNRAFNMTALKEYQPRIAQRATQLVDRLAHQKGTVVDLALWISWFAFDFMGDLAFGGGGTMLQRGDGDALWRTLKDGLAVTTLFEQLPWLPYILKTIPPLQARASRMRALGINRAITRFEQGGQLKDVFYYLNNEDGAQKENPPKPVVISDGFLVLIAGSDTTATVLASLFWCLLTHPDVYKRLRDEVDTFYPPEEDSTSPRHHSQMVYLEAVINEALRLFPPVPSGSQRAPLVGGGDRAIGPYYIPEGTSARMHTLSMHRDPRNFSYPESFWPERWLIADGLAKGGEEEGFVHNSTAFIPFSFGPANCVGKPLAMQEMRMVVCHVMQKLDLQLDDGDGWDPKEFERSYKEYTVAEVGRLPVRVQPRK